MHDLLSSDNPNWLMRILRCVITQPHLHRLESITKIIERIMIFMKAVIRSRVCIVNLIPQLYLSFAQMTP